MKFVLFFPLGTYALSMDWVDFCWVEWHEIRVIYEAFPVVVYAGKAWTQVLTGY